MGPQLLSGTATTPCEALDPRTRTRVTASELAFLALGLLLGAATGAAILVAMGSRLGRQDVRVTVTRDALRRRSETLSQDAFVTRPAEPARGGPGDRRVTDRDGGGPLTERMTRTTGTPLATPRERAPFVAPDRTLVPSTGSAVGIAIETEVDRDLDELRRRPAQGAPLERMLRGEHRAMVEVVDALAGADSRQRRNWEMLLGGLVEAMADAAVRESVIAFPMGTAFWDTFTIEQCRRIVVALGSMGYRYDGVAGWEGGRAPAYRDLTLALADIGIDPRRVRAWPNQAEIAALFVGARPAPEELLPAAGPDYTAEAMQGLIGERAPELADLWTTWEDVRPTLLDDRDPAEPQDGTAAPLEPDVGSEDEPGG